MKKMPIFTLAIASALFMNPVTLRADVDASATVSINASSDFYGPLGAYGAWVQVNDYGRCFRPADAGVGWRPYCDGHWEWTDDGWYWDSDQPWAWACYHYGQWAYDSAYGWVWVPGTQWAPAWVCWRFGDGYIGWAPMPPQGHSLASDADDDAFVFVRADHFDEPVNTSDVIVNNHTVIEHTRYISNVKPVTKNIAGVGTASICENDGPGLAKVEKACGKTFRPVPVSDVYGRRASETRWNSRSQPPAMQRHENTERHETRQQAPWPPANAQPETGTYKSGQPGTGNDNHPGQRHHEMPPPENQNEYQQPQTTRPGMNDGQNPARPIPNYTPQRTTRERQSSPSEGSTPRRLEPLQSDQPHSTTGANPAGHVPKRTVGHGKVMQRGQPNSTPASNPGQNNADQNPHQGR